MIIRTVRSVTKGVYSASVDVETTSLEDEFIKAYGEPQIDLKGAIPFTPSTPQQAPGQIDLAQSVDLGTPPVAGSSTDNPGLGTAGVEVNGSGTFPNGLTSSPGHFKHAVEVVSDFEFKARLLTVDGSLYDDATDPATVDGFRVGLALFFGDAADDPGVILGWGSHNSAFNIALWQRTTKGGAYVEVNTVARSKPNGIMLRLTRTSSALKAEYSFDSGETWTTLGQVTLTQTTYRAGLFVNSGNAQLATGLFDEVSLTQTPVEDVNTFTITGQQLVNMHSQAPHAFSLDGNIDPEAEAKVQGWAKEIELRLANAKSALLTNNDQPGEDNVDVSQV